MSNNKPKQSEQQPPAQKIEDILELIKTFCTTIIEDDIAVLIVLADTDGKIVSTCSHCSRCMSEALEDNLDRNKVQHRSEELNEQQIEKIH